MAEKFAVITGAGTGIGRACALALFKEGYSIALAGRRMDKLEEVASHVPSGQRAICHATDVGDPAQVETLFARVKSEFGRLDLLFNNAGLGTRTATEDLSYADWMTAVNTNLTGTFLCSQQAMRIMKDQRPMGGRIVNNGSISAHAPRPNSAAYTSTKHGVTGLTKAFNLDGRKYDIAVGQIDIGNSASEMAERMRNGVPQADGRIVPEPLMSLEGVAKALVYMAGLPLDENVLTMTVMASKMPFVGRG